MVVVFVVRLIRLSLCILVDDGDFLAFISEIVRKRCKDTTRVTEVQVQAAEELVGLVRSERMIASATRWLMRLLS